MRTKYRSGGGIKEYLKRGQSLTNLHKGISNLKRKEVSAEPKLVKDESMFNLDNIEQEVQ